MQIKWQKCSELLLEINSLFCKGQKREISGTYGRASYYEGPRSSFIIEKGPRCPDAFRDVGTQCLHFFLFFFHDQALCSLPDGEIYGLNVP